MPLTAQPTKPSPAKPAQATPLERVMAWDAAFTRWLQRFADQPGNQWKLFALLFGVVLVTSFPDYGSYLRPGYAVNLTRQALLAQAEHPLTPAQYEPTEHVSQLAFRLTLPIISHFLHIPMRAWHLIALPALILFWTMLARTLRRRSQDGLAALLGVAGIADLYASRSFITDTHGWFDSFAYLAMAATLCVRAPAWLFVIQLAGCYLDERVYMMAPFAMIYWQWQQAQDKSLPVSIRSFFKPSPQALAILAALVVGVALRMYLSHSFGLSLTVRSQRGLSFATWEENLNLSATAIFSGLEMFGLAALGFHYYVGRRFGAWVGWASLAYYVACMAAMLIVLDHTRTQSYLIMPALAGVFCLVQVEGPRLRISALKLMAYGSWLVPPTFLISYIYTWLGYPPLSASISILRKVGAYLVGWL